MKKAIEIAQYIINTIKIDNLKLQKLLYYCQATNLVINNDCLFSNEIEAWQYGPVIPDVYHRYKKYGFDFLEVESTTHSDLNVEELEVIDMVLDYYGEMSGIHLVNKTHSEDPWKNVYEPNSNNVISTESMKKYYSNIITVE